MDSSSIVANREPEGRSEEVLGNPSETLYIRNIEEKIRLTLLKQILEHLFGAYGKVLSVQARKTLRMRGQAFVVFENIQDASRALQDLQGYPLYGKPMMIQFSRTKSDAIVSLQNPQELEAKKVQRRERREYLKRTGALQPPAPKPAHKKQPVKRTAPGERKLNINEDLLPPNKVLLLQNLPQEVTAEILTQIFEAYQGFQEVRMVPGRRGIAFVEYDTEREAGIAKNGTTGMALSGNQVKVTFARKAS
ncbi:U1 snRNP-associated protein Usp102 [Schizosaccharomyces cryophilus OY26]|uniref:U1 snRNP-associated protein Usp102 n=1 Tax=Schizosaccharomyces cryophilus (strain OY26 / ATCC MYA-4695 / CBS 11777 / NBRC 106824 / NRRL Y48691) TaxID=653667 RepID=S9VW60_SCHCR|nr:U1 snRNP-associated protein Usp102 [Schizosaccharomyces cryophilus OY26]EPY50469.1 U1 snRNP-associated protein Usp102 [Schizosaccharomyces cryophilus OY26]